MTTIVAPPIRAEQLFAEAAQDAPERVALLYRERTWTFAAFDAEGRRRARALRAAALPPGAAVVAIAPLSDDLLLAWLACCHLGLIFCHLSTQYTVHEVAPLAARAAARLALTRDGVPHPLLPDLPALPLDLPGGGEADAVFSPVGTPEDTALLATTSGTTGPLPKLAIVPHRALTWRRHLPVWYEERPGVSHHHAKLQEPAAANLHRDRATSAAARRQHPRPGEVGARTGACGDTVPDDPARDPPPADR